MIATVIDLYHRLDAYYSMARAVKHFNLHFPEMKESQEPLIKAKGLYHLLLQTPVAYDIILNPQTNFFFLTGANMAGKKHLYKIRWLCGLSGAYRNGCAGRINGIKFV